jgi:hypothetical protein
LPDCTGADLTATPSLTSATTLRLSGPHDNSLPSDDPIELQGAALYTSTTNPLLPPAPPRHPAELLPDHDNPPPPPYGSLFDEFYPPPSPAHTPYDLHLTNTLDGAIVDANSVEHVVCAPRVCGLHGDLTSRVRICPDTGKPDKMVDGGSNVCVTGDLRLLLDVVDINPIQISVALAGTPAFFDDCITKRGLLPLTMTDGSCYYQVCYYCANLVKTIISPLALLATSNVFVQWQQIGYKDPTVPGSLHFMSHNRLASMHFSLQCRDGLYYYDTDIYTIDKSPVHVHCRRAMVNPPTKAPQPHRPASKFQPTLRARQVESEVWALRFGSPGKGQLDVLPKHVNGIPPLF